MKIKRLLVLVLSMLLVLSSPAGAAPKNGGGTDTGNTPAGEKTGGTERTYIFTNDGSTMVTDAAFDPYFDGTAADGVAKLLDAGAVYVNGIKVPATGDETVSYQVNGLSCLYKTASGWGYNVHKTTSADNLSFKDARLGFLQTVSTVRGHTVSLYLDDKGHAAKINATSLEAVRVADVIVYNESTTVDRGDFTLETNRVRPDVNNIIFHSSKVDQTIKVSDFAVYWFDENGWNIKRAVPVTGALSKDTNKFVIGGNDSRMESNVSRYNLYNANRPTQFFTAYTRLGLTDVPIITWCTDTGHPIGFTYGKRDEAKKALTRAIANAAAFKEGIVVSADGTDVGAGKKWVTQQDLDEYDAALAAARVIRNDNKSSSMKFDNAIYDLSLALGDGGDNPTGFIGAQGEGTKR
jgi:hypothetical protein